MIQIAESNGSRIKSILIGSTPIPVIKSRHKH